MIHDFCCATHKHGALWWYEVVQPWPRHTNTVPDFLTEFVSSHIKASGVCSHNGISVAQRREYYTQSSFLDSLDLVLEVNWLPQFSLYLRDAEVLSHQTSFIDFCWVDFNRNLKTIKTSNIPFLA